MSWIRCKPTCQKQHASCTIQRKKIAVEPCSEDVKNNKNMNVHGYLHANARKFNVTCYVASKNVQVRVYTAKIRRGRRNDGVHPGAMLFIGAGVDIYTVVFDPGVVVDCINPICRQHLDEVGVNSVGPLEKGVSVLGRDVPQWHLDQGFYLGSTSFKLNFIRVYPLSWLVQYNIHVHFYNSISTARVMSDVSNCFPCIMMKRTQHLLQHFDFTATLHTF